MTFKSVLKIRWYGDGAEELPTPCSVSAPFTRALLGRPQKDTEGAWGPMLASSRRAQRRRLETLEGGFRGIWLLPLMASQRFLGRRRDLGKMRKTQHGEKTWPLLVPQIIVSLVVKLIHAHYREFRKHRKVHRGIKISYNPTRKNNYLYCVIVLFRYTNFLLLPIFMIINIVKNVTLMTAPYKCAQSHLCKIAKIDHGSYF